MSGDRDGIDGRGRGRPRCYAEASLAARDPGRAAVGLPLEVGA